MAPKHLSLGIGRSIRAEDVPEGEEGEDDDCRCQKDEELMPCQGLAQKEHQQRDNNSKRDEVNHAGLENLPDPALVRFYGFP